MLDEKVITMRANICSTESNIIPFSVPQVHCFLFVCLFSILSLYCRQDGTEVPWSCSSGRATKIFTLKEVLLP